MGVVYYNVSTGVWYITMLIQGCGILQCQYRGVVYYNVSTGVWYITMLAQGVVYYNVSTGCGVLQY